MLASSVQGVDIGIRWRRSGTETFFAALAAKEVDQIRTDRCCALIGGAAATIAHRWILAEQCHVRRIEIGLFGSIQRCLGAAGGKA